MSTQPLRNLDWNEILERISEEATCSKIKENIRLTAPLASSQASLAQMEEIESARLILRGGAVRPIMSSLDLFTLWHERLKRTAVLKPMEFRDIRLFCMETLALHEVLKPYDDLPWATELSAQIMDAHRPLSAIDQVMLPTGEIRTDASETLYTLYQNKINLEREIRNTLDKLVKKHELENLLQDRYVTNREGRWVLPVKSGMRHNLEGIIHDSSQTKQTVFMEPQAVVEINNRLRQVLVDIDREIERLLQQLSQFLGGMAVQFEQTKAALEMADLRFAQARFSDKIEGHPVVFCNDSLEFSGLRHPLLVLKLLEYPQRTVVSNHVDLVDGKRVLLLSGPNAGGKTVLLKALGLACHMARCGLPVAADRARIPFFQNLFVSIGDAQSVDDNLSTFAGHLLQLSKATAAQGPKDLILIDEICGSTDPEEGAALARSFIEAYAKQGAFGVITSHLGPLKEGWDTKGAVINGCMDFDEKNSRPTYRLVLGIFGRSLALKTAQAVGVPNSVVERALDLLGPAAKERERKLSELDEYKAELLKLRTQLDEENKLARDNRQKYMDLVEKFRKERDSWMKKTIEMGEQKIEKLMEDMRQDRSKFKSVHDMKAQLPEIVKGTRERKIQSADEFAKQFPPGTPVFVRSLNQDGVVQGLPNAKGEVAVLSNSMRLSVPWEELAGPRNSKSPTVEILRRSGHPISASPLDMDTTIDLRGQRVEEALVELEKQLDLAVRRQADRVRIVHGHGTEALKKAVRSFLSRSAYVRVWKAGDTESGGDGLTWAELA